MNLKYTIIILTLAFIAPSYTLQLYAQKGLAKENFIAEYLYSKPIDRNLHRIDIIDFKGNSYFKSAELSSIIVSKITSKGIPHKFIDYYYDNFNANPATPSYIQSLLQSALKNYTNEIYYFSESQAENDLSTLKDYYNKFGYHDAEVKFAFFPDTLTKTNNLVFYIDENERYKITTLKYFGLDSLPAEISKGVGLIMQSREGDYFNEPKIMYEVSSVLDYLRNNGYYKAYYQYEPVTIDSDKYEDSLSVTFYPGIRYRIDKIYYADSTGGQKPVAKAMKKMSVAIKSGDWYSRKKVKQSENNLNEMGVFENVYIDTTKFDEKDSLLNLMIFTRYKLLRNWQGAFLVNQTTEANNLYNLGLEGEFSWKNIFGAAENFSLYGNSTIRNYSGQLLPPLNEFQLQGRLGFLFNQPLFVIIDNTRFGIESRFEYELSNYRDLLLRKISLPKARIPFKFPSITYLNRGYFELILEEERPMDSIRVSSNNIDQDILQYAILQDYFQDNPFFRPTALIFGAAVIGDSKNNPFSPTEGNYSFISADFGLLSISQYARIVFQRNDYFSSPLSRNIVHATKFKIGNIFLFGENGYVPFDRQFYAGGANSIRGWQARTLHPYDTYFWENSDNFEDGVDLRQEFDDFSNLIGNGGIIEMTYEYRYRFKQPEDMMPTIAEQLANLGFALFADVGNAFNWYATDYSTEIYNYFNPLEWAYSVGFGIRYETPIGPVRLDFALPVFGPVYGKKDWIVGRDRVLQDIQWHFSIGNPF